MPSQLKLDISCMNSGQQPKSDAMKALLANTVKRKLYLGEHDWVIVHHFTDRPNGVQLECEIRYEYIDEGIEFLRIYLE